MFNNLISFFRDGFDEALRCPSKFDYVLSCSRKITFIMSNFVIPRYTFDNVWFCPSKVTLMVCHFVLPRHVWWCSVLSFQGRWSHYSLQRPLSLYVQLFQAIDGVMSLVWSAFTPPLLPPTWRDSASSSVLYISLPRCKPLVICQQFNNLLDQFRCLPRVHDRQSFACQTDKQSRQIKFRQASRQPGHTVRLGRQTGSDRPAGRQTDRQTAWSHRQARQTDRLWQTGRQTDRQADSLVTQSG